MKNSPIIDGELVATLSALAGLPLAESRRQAVAKILEVWIPDANALSEKMSASKYQEIGPATIFAHSTGVDEETELD